MINQRSGTAMQVAGGYRRPLPKFIPEPLQALITECWAQNPKDRPPITEVVDRLTAFQKAPELPSNGAGRNHQGENPAKKGCCSVM